MVFFPSNPVLLIDDEINVLDGAALSLRLEGITHVEKCPESTEVELLLSKRKFSVIVLDLLMPNITGLELLPKIRQMSPESPVIIMTAVNEVESAVKCMKDGAYDYLLKPVHKDTLVSCVRRALECWELRGENDRLRTSMLAPVPSNGSPYTDIITRDPQILSIFKYIEAVAPTSMPVLITGETGTGKELIARSVHNASSRSGEFVAVNVAGLDDNLFSDTLFGHLKGAFTGAMTARQGLVARASGGTLFLDEIGDLAPESQVKLLRLLEAKTFYPIGSDKPCTTDARIVVATNRTINELKEDKKFRDDLFYRLRTHHIHLPPLRERKGDLLLLTETFLEHAAEEMKKRKPTAPEEISILLSTYSFPGNIRELKSLIYDAVSRHQGGILSLESLKAAILPQNKTVQRTADDNVSLGVQFGSELPTLKEVESMLVEEALRRAQGNQTIAASFLGITRSALCKRLSKMEDL
jgi:DNA-binding NtrC family response regulator